MCLCLCTQYRSTHVFVEVGESVSEMESSGHKKRGGRRSYIV